MIAAEAQVRIERPIAVVFQYVAIEFFANYRKWSPEVIALEPSVPGPITVGVTALQVRRDFGYRSKARFRVSQLEFERRLCFEALTRPRFRITYRFEPDNGATRLIFTFELDPERYWLPFRRAIAQATQGASEAVVRRIKFLLESSGGAE
ncbi:MAG: SRPBCC family protein [Thiotrichales bacterium]